MSPYNFMLQYLIVSVVSYDRGNKVLYGKMLSAQHNNDRDSPRR